MAIGSGLKAPYASVVTTPRERADDVYAVAGGRAWASSDAGLRWELRSDGLPASEHRRRWPSIRPIANRLWSVVADQVYRSDDQGRRWRLIGQPVPERPVVAHALTVVDHTIVMATDRGVFRSTDDGAHWTLGSDTLPAHLDAGMLARDPLDAPTTIYAGFAVRSHESPRPGRAPEPEQRWTRSPRSSWPVAPASSPWPSWAPWSACAASCAPIGATRCPR